MNNVGDTLRVKQLQHARICTKRAGSAAHEVPDYPQDIVVRIREDCGILLNLAQNP